MNYSPLVRDHVRARYFSGQEPSTIAKATKVKLDIINEWILNDGWETQRRDRVSAELHARSDVIIAQEKPNLIERQVRIAQKLDSHIEKALDKKVVKPRDLVNISKAAAASMGVAESALNLKKASSLQLFVQFNLRPLPVAEAVRQGVISDDDVKKAIDVPSQTVPEDPFHYEPDPF